MVAQLRWSTSRLLWNYSSCTSLIWYDYCFPSEKKLFARDRQQHEAWLKSNFISCVQIFLRNLRERRRSIYSKCLSLGILVLEKPALSRDMYINFSLYTTELQYPFFKVDLKEMQLQFVAKSLWYYNECSFHPKLVPCLHCISSLVF